MTDTTPTNSETRTASTVQASGLADALDERSESTAASLPPAALSAGDCAAIGLHVMPLHPRSKRPLYNAWTGLAPMSAAEIAEHWARAPTQNYGVICGRPIAGGTAGFLAVVDVDVATPADLKDALAAAAEHFGPTEQFTMRVKTGGGGWHLYGRSTEPLRSGIIAKAPDTVPLADGRHKRRWQVELKATGCQVVGADCVHPDTGRRYVALDGFTDPAGWPVITAPARVEAPAAPPAPPPAAPSSAAPEHARKRLDALLSDLSAKVAQAPQGERNAQLFQRTASAAGARSNGHRLDSGPVERAMLAAAVACGLPHDEAVATIRSGLQRGEAAPYELPDRDRPEPQRERHEHRDAEPLTIRQKTDGDRPQLRLIPSVIRADIPDHAERSVLGPYLPRGEVTLLAGHGGSGKTAIAASWAVAVAAGLPWAGAQADVGRVLFASFEDSAPRVRSLLRCACRAAGMPYSAAEAVDLIDGTESTDGALWVGDDNGGRAIPTAAAAELGAAILSGRYSLVIVDNTSETYAANENNRRDVRAFIRWLRTLARAVDCAVLLLAHVNAQTARHGGNGQAFSGSTAWHNSVRSRLAIVDGCRLAHEKRQYGRSVEDLQLRFDDAGMLVPVGVITEKRRAELPRCMTGEDAELQRRQVEADHDALILAAMPKAIAAGDLPGINRKGTGNARAALEAHGVDIPTAEFWAAVDRMQADGRLRIAETMKGNRHARQHFAPAADGVKVT